MGLEPLGVIAQGVARPLVVQCRLVRAACPVLLSTACLLVIAASDARAQQPAPPAPVDALPEQPVPPPPSAGDPSVPSEAVPPPPGADGSQARLRMLVVDAAAYAIDPVVARHVTARMRLTAAAMGYDVLTGEASVAAARAIAMPYPPSPADLWRVMHAGGAQRAAFARVWAHGGQYVYELTVASADGTGPFFARGNSGADDLHATVERLTRQVLPPPTQWNAAEAERIAARARRPRSEPLPTQPTARSATEAAGERDDEWEEDDFERPLTRAGRQDREQQPVGRRWQLALQTEAVIGTSDDGFYNHLVGARLDRRLTRATFVGAYAAYANLRGKDGRVHNVALAAQIEHRVRLSAGSDVSLPLRFALGMLPFNGPFLRFSGGLNVPLSERWELGADVIVPTFWMLPGDMTA
ncbi:MAG: hypothetical protein NZ898_15150, partial [Myxococcota bacterium]|nr:hypothetical protein [Myxococcota bacterium]